MFTLSHIDKKRVVRLPKCIIISIYLEYLELIEINQQLLLSISCIAPPRKKFYNFLALEVFNERITITLYH